jgi:GR25 family glycosyltransferase involved in LPS biosynthesis
MNGKACVLNLTRRPDRLDRFKEFYAKYGPELPLMVFNAIDGSIPEEFNRVPETIIKSLSEQNDYNNKTSIRATAMGHMLLWKKLLESDEDYFLIFEDDCYFRPDNNLLPEISSGSMKTKWDKIITEYAPNLKERKNVLYFGVGDLLPLHTTPPSESILIAQESNHVLKPHTGKYYGCPNFKSPYVYSWIGCSSYLISKPAAKYLLAIAAKQPLKCAIDAWLKKLYENKIIDIYFTIPLMTYTPNILDSNTSFADLEANNKYF